MSRARFRHVAPAGAPIRAGDLGRWLLRLPFARHAVADLEAAFRRVTGVAHCRATRTGRAGLTILLRAFSRLSDTGRDEVIVPSYTCYSVAAAVLKAGLRPRIVDVVPETLDFDHSELEATDTSRVLAIVATNLYGLPNDLPRLASFASSRGLFLVDDAAQALGATVGGRPSGTWGDAGLYSVDKGKNVSAVDGGVLVTQSDQVAAALDAELQGLPDSRVSESALAVVKVLAYAALLHPRFYWIPNAIPQLGLGRTLFTTEFTIGRPVRVLSALAARTVLHLDEYTRVRRANAASLLAPLHDACGLRPIRPLEHAVPVYLRLPLLAASPQERDRLVQGLRAVGVGATGSYPQSIADIPELAVSGVRCNGGRHVAAHILTVPTHPFVTAETTAIVAQAVRSVLPDEGQRDSTPPAHR